MDTTKWILLNGLSVATGGLSSWLVEVASVKRLGFNEIDLAD